MLPGARRRSQQFVRPAGTEQVQKVFRNGDKYTGGWANGRPQGEGSYTWFDGNQYEGGWKDGKKDGLGTYVWTTGARYYGEWVDGCMHGVGTFEAPDGTTYQGSWSHDMKQGLGRKLFSNGDVYEGLWRENRFHGPGRYRWRNRDEYDGEWNMGMMQGRGTLRWKTGDRYDGEFADGNEDGLGIFTWSNGSTYDGFWQMGLKHGLGVYRPAPVEANSKLKPAPDSSEHSGTPESITTHGFPRFSSEIKRSTDSCDAGNEREPPVGMSLRKEVFGGSLEGPISRRNLHDAAQGDTLAGAALGPPAEGGHAERILVREYESGRLLREQVLTAEELEAVLGKDERRRQEQDLWSSGSLSSGKERAGEKIYKGHHSYDLMLNLQLGIRFSVGRVSADDNPKELAPEHFSFLRRQYFPRDGSPNTPPHPSCDFGWKDYCPAAFRKLRDVFSIDRADFMTSICGDQALRELPSPGKSGSVFFLSHDDKYVIKTMRRGEVKLLLNLLPRYVEHVRKYPHTLLIKFYGLYRVTPTQGGKPTTATKVHFIVMNNLFRTELPIHRKYDLKGSILGRTALQEPGPNVILKDQDLNIRLVLDTDWHQKMMRQLEVDCALLEELRVIDYSLLLGIHFKSPADASPPPRAADKEDEAEEEEGADGDRPSIDLSTAAPTPTTATNGHHRSLWSSESREADAAMQKAQRRALKHENAWRHRILQRLGSGVDEQKMKDLLRLATFRMLSREPRRRSPTRMLACRSLGSSKRTPSLRAVSEREEATDELTHRLGGSRVQLGMNMKVTCLPKKADIPSAAPEEGVCYFGIIDILQEYNMRKRLEHGYKSLRHGSDVISAVDPVTYSLRFQNFLKKLFG